MFQRPAIQPPVRVFIDCHQTDYEGFLVHARAPPLSVHAQVEAQLREELEAERSATVMPVVCGV